MESCVRCEDHALNVVLGTMALVTHAGLISKKY